MTRYHIGQTNKSSPKWQGITSVKQTNFLQNDKVSHRSNKQIFSKMKRYHIGQTNKSSQKWQGITSVKQTNLLQNDKVSHRSNKQIFSKMKRYHIGQTNKSSQKWQGITSVKQTVIWPRRINVRHHSNWIGFAVYQRCGVWIPRGKNKTLFHLKM
jgi:hypothetical protein